MAGTPVSGVAGMEYHVPTFPASTDPLIRWQIGVITAAVKCDLCAYDHGHPHCVDACITNALRLVEDPDDGDEIERKRVVSGYKSIAMLENFDPRENDPEAARFDDSAEGGK